MKRRKSDIERRKNPMECIDEIHALIPAAQMSPEAELIGRIEELLREHGWFVRRMFTASAVYFPERDEDGFIRGMNFSSVRYYCGGVLLQGDGVKEDFDDTPRRAVVNLVPRDTPVEGPQRDHDLVIRIYED
jgi:hypothetical protein